MNVLCVLAPLVCFTSPVRALSIHTLNGQDVRWSAVDQHHITYCIESGFRGFEELLLESALAQATAAWEAVADVDFVHLSSQDGAACTADNDAVLFRIRRVCCDAFAYTPNFPPQDRVFGMGGATLTSDESGAPDSELVSITTHELGHILGFAHEHMVCLPNDDYTWAPPGFGQRIINQYDVNSIMHYRGTCGSESGESVITPLDAEGAAQIYGQPTDSPGGAPDVCDPNLECPAPLGCVYQGGDSCACGRLVCTGMPPQLVCAAGRSPSRNSFTLPLFLAIGIAAVNWGRTRRRTWRKRAAV